MRYQNSRNEKIIRWNRSKRRSNKSKSERAVLRLKQVRTKKIKAVLKPTEFDEQ